MVSSPAPPMPATVHNGAPPGEGEMQRVRITRPRRSRNESREAERHQILPLDPRDPAIVRAKGLERKGKCSMRA